MEDRVFCKEGFPNNGQVNGLDQKYNFGPMIPSSNSLQNKTEFVNVSNILDWWVGRLGIFFKWPGNLIVKTQVNLVG